MRYVLAVAALLAGLLAAGTNPPTNCNPTQTVACYR